MPATKVLVKHVIGDETVSKLNSVSVSKNTIQRRITKWSADINEQVIAEVQGSKYEFAIQLDSAVTSSFGAPLQTSIMGPHFLVQNVQLGYFLQYRNHCVSLEFFDDSVL